MMANNQQNLVKIFIQFIKFCIVGVSNTLLTLLVIILITNLLSVPDKPANFIGYLLGLVNSFFWNKVWTFKSKGFKAGEVLLFILVFAVSYGLQFLCLTFLLDHLQFQYELHFMDFKLKIAHLISMVVFTVSNYIGNKLITFKSRG